MSPVLAALLHTVLGVLLSKKVLTAALTALASMFIADATQQAEVVALGVAVIAGFAAQDVGKERAAISAGVPSPALKGLVISPPPRRTLFPPDPVPNAGRTLTTEVSTEMPTVSMRPVPPKP